MSSNSCRGGDVMTVMEELGRLIRSTPGPGASATQVAHWYELKAHMLEHLAEEDEAGRHTALCQAEAAHRHASALVRTGR
jgi:hypothetical protein